MEQHSINHLINSFKENSSINCTGISGAEKAYVILKLFRELKHNIFVFVPNEKEGGKLIEDIAFFSSRNPVHPEIFPDYNLKLPSSQNYGETSAKRIKVLYQLLSAAKPNIYILTPIALIQKLIPINEFDNYLEIISENKEINIDALLEKLISGGYSRTAVVEEPGEFCLRGGIFDIFSPIYNAPIRIELYGDLVDSMRFFSPESQRKTETIREAIILPASEAVLKKEYMDAFIGRVKMRASEIDIPISKVRSLIDSIAKENNFPLIQNLIPLLYPKLDTIFDYIPKKSVLVLSDESELEKTVNDFFIDISHKNINLKAKNDIYLEPESMYFQWSETRNSIKNYKYINFGFLPIKKAENTESKDVQLNFFLETNRELSDELKNFGEKENILLPLAEWIKKKRELSYLTLIVCSTKSQLERMKSLLFNYNIKLSFMEGFPDSVVGRGLVYGCLGYVSSGFVWQDEFLAIITEDEIFGVKRRRKKIVKHSVRTDLLALQELKTGDLVVHNQHGIGQYQGLYKLKLSGVSNDFILVEYQDRDKLYVPVENMNAIQKYVGVDGIDAVLDKMGGKSWERVKLKAKKSAEKIAGELLKLYAERKAKKGYQFSRVDSYFKDFEAGFAYEETPDQLKAIEDVLEDMESANAMDRLICGDVGYGKTEVALRSSFKAVSDGKQVAILVPTTVLAEQHFLTFKKRFERYPIEIRCLNRFKSKKEQSITIDELKEGKADIVIGTHRLLQKDISFKDLGLVVLDEEQRFGVKHKEKLKQMKTNVDVLALSATPIPRTLHMSLMGIRDISVISTPPEQRYPIETFILQYDETVIAEGIRKELKRNGQLYFVHNNIETIWKIANKMNIIVPEARIGVAHGQMNEDELEKVMLKFVNKEIDMLVTTTIIESGLDIPNANTIFINRADRFGLSQIYQLRGRVGRANEQAYAYIFVPDELVLSKDAKKRLKVLMDNNDLGSGFQIAMSDLKIRGGGTVLGSSQSGHIAAVGYDMFLKLMENSVAELKGEQTIEELEPEINITMNAYIPESYISDIDQRLLIYRRLARCSDLKELNQMKEEIIDRYSTLPIEFENLFIKIMLKIMAAKAGVKKIDYRGQEADFYFSPAHQKNPLGIIKLAMDKTKNLRFLPDNSLTAKLSHTKINAHLLQIKNILKDITQSVQM
ncbi:MAG: transcription-repair coupling factor [Desulfobacterales bacterium]|nr:transcription-repair coupling factor [Desulfobacterales bacterium]